MKTAADVRLAKNIKASGDILINARAGRCHECGDRRAEVDRLCVTCQIENPEVTS